MSNYFKTFIILFIVSFFTSDKLNACTRILYKGPNKTNITARSMDWKTEIPANMWLFPSGIKRDGLCGAPSVIWESKFGSLITSSWDIASTDGMNEKGLVGNLLWLVESEYPLDEQKNKPCIAVSLWLQYVLDMFSNVKEVVEALKDENFIIKSSTIPGTEIFASVHLSVSDNSGDSAIFEYIDGKLIVHHDSSYQVMTNSPIFEKQIAINEYWKSIPGTIMLPGTNRASDRFVRSSYYIKAIPQTDDSRTALASVFSVIRNASVPFGISSETEPNISSTRWRTVSDHKNLTYYFENILNPNVIWVDLKKLDFGKGAKIKKLKLENGENYFAESSANFTESKPFLFAPFNK